MIATELPVVVVDASPVTSFARFVGPGLSQGTAGRRGRGPRPRAVRTRDDLRSFLGTKVQKAVPDRHLLLERRGVALHAGQCADLAEQATHRHDRRDQRKSGDQCFDE